MIRQFGDCLVGQPDDITLPNNDIRLEGHWNPGVFVGCPEMGISRASVVGSRVDVIDKYSVAAQNSSFRCRGFVDLAYPARKFSFQSL